MIVRHQAIHRKTWDNTSWDSRMAEIWRHDPVLGRPHHLTQARRHGLLGDRVRPPGVPDARALG